MAQKKKPTHLRLAAIDIGSNAIRMVIADFSTDGMRMIQKYRFPIRLGADVFAEGKISAQNLKLSARTFKKFKEVSEKFNVSQIRAVGTSALREAKNQNAFVELIRRKSQIPIEIIDGVEEARLIHQAVRHEVQLDTHQALLIDIGGGSVELTYSEQGMMTATQSFPFGTVRTLELMKRKKLSESQLSLVIGDFLSPLTHFIQSHGPGHALDFAIGTGGNLESLGKLKPLLLKSSSRTFLTFNELAEILRRLEKMTIKERIEKLKMRPDRADVIVPAGLMIQTVMRQANLSKLLIPHVGLKDGLLWSLAQRADYLSKSLG
jgi:exopolyphosphatase/guanosine-5'-triphosphate,3'-diphosphate pyrophosphatase